MRQIEVRFEGLSPLLLNRFHAEASEESTNGVHAMHKVASRTPAEDAALRLYDDDAIERLEEGHLNGRPWHLPAENLRQSIIAASSYTKIGRKQATTIIAAGLLVKPTMLELHGAWELDTRAVVIPATKGRIVRYRPSFPAWSLDAVLEYDEDLFDERTLRQIVDDAGKKVGIGDYRPAKKGPYGKFNVQNWTRVVPEVAVASVA